MRRDVQSLFSAGKKSRGVGCVFFVFFYLNFLKRASAKIFRGKGPIVFNVLPAAPLHRRA